MGCRKLQHWSIIEFDDKTSTHEVGFILRLRHPDGLSNLAYVNNGVTSYIDWLGGFTRGKTAEVKMGGGIGTKTYQKLLVEALGCNSASCRGYHLFSSYIA